MPFLSVVVPVYNEGENIARFLDGLAAVALQNSVVTLIYDSDEDNTLPAAQAKLSSLPYPVVFLKNKYGRGVLNAMKTGLEEAQAEFVLVTMADLSDPPEDIVKMLDAAVKEDCDIVCASRYMPGGKQVGGPLIKGMLSRLAGKSLRFLTGMQTHDPTNNFKLYRKSFLETITFESTGGFEIGLELTVKAYLNGYKITEVPSSWFDRSAGKSNFKLLKWLPKYLKWYLKAIFSKPCQREK